jgi:hypothetical protein
MHNIKTDHKEKVLQGMDWTELAQDSDKLQARVNM